MLYDIGTYYLYLLFKWAIISSIQSFQLIWKKIMLYSEILTQKVELWIHSLISLVKNHLINKKINKYFQNILITNCNNLQATNYQFTYGRQLSRMNDLLKVGSFQYIELLIFERSTTFHHSHTAQPAPWWKISLEILANEWIMIS